MQSKNGTNTEPAGRTDNVNQETAEKSESPGWVIPLSLVIGTVLSIVTAIVAVRIAVGAGNSDTLTGLSESNFQLAMFASFLVTLITSAVIGLTWIVLSPRNRKFVLVPAAMVPLAGGSATVFVLVAMMAT